MLKRLAYVSPKNSRTGAEGAGAEISEIAKLEAGRHLIKIQPRANDHQMFREALCRNGPIQGEWYLEVKHFPYLSPELAMKIFADQAESHLRRCKLANIMNEGEFAESPGLVFRFSSSNGNFNTYAGSILTNFRHQLELQFKNAPKHLIDDWFNNKLIIEEIK